MVLCNGFYLKWYNEYDENGSEDFGFLENEFEAEENDMKLDAHHFLHGFCDSFAACLNKEFGYEMQAIYDENMRLVHVYCVHKSADGNVFIDVRGCINDFEAFIYEFGDFITITEDEPVNIRTYKPNFSSLQYTDTAMKLIQKFRDYYIPKFDK